MSTTLPYNNDWARLVADVAIAWGEDEFAGCHRLDALLEAVRTSPDATLAALLRRAQRGDALAGRVVVQAMLGKLVRMAARDPQADLDDYVAQLWCVLMTYPADRRRRRVAAGLALDTLKAVVAERPVLTVIPVDAAPADQECAAVVLARARTQGLLTGAEHDVLHAVYVDGETSAAVAAARDVSAGAIRQACRTALRRLARHRDDLRWSEQAQAA